MEDDFWNTSSTSKFNFDDDDEDFTSSTDQEPIFQPINEDSLCLPVHSLLTRPDLTAILGTRPKRSFPQDSVQDTIKAMIYGRRYCLEQFRAFEDKQMLLIEAINSCNGNVVMEIIFFLKKTLKINIFYYELARHKAAIKHLTNCLVKMGRVRDLCDLYMATGKSAQLKNYVSLVGKEVKDKKVLFHKIEKFIMENNLMETDKKSEFQDHFTFLTWQIQNDETADSVIEQLAALCKKEWSVNKNAFDRISQFKKIMKIDEFSFEWTIMNVMASLEMWFELFSMFIKPNWLTKKKAVKCSMNPELFIYGLSRHKPPSAVLEQYLTCLSDTESAMRLAKKLNCHKFIVMQLLSQKDRLGLIEYKSRLSPKSPEYEIIEKSLSSDKKWKN